MSSSPGLAVVVVYFACAMATTAAQAESAAEWLAPKWFNEWHDGLAANGLNFSVTYIGDNITNISGGTAQILALPSNFNLSGDANRDRRFTDGAKAQAATSHNRDEPLTSTLRPLRVITGTFPFLVTSRSAMRSSMTSLFKVENLDAGVRSAFSVSH
jgi:hypothetical protein